MTREQAAQTLDAFHRGNFWLVQPKGVGHRAGVDAMILAASVPSDFSGKLADFGAGGGSRRAGCRLALPGRDGDACRTIAGYGAFCVADACAS